ncbi:hypothetical protein HNY73_009176 [Argiope bruennichi]|uniref:Uncharacterized protein n=1 Tax=Argiope bruennichi TaxID=94029 RepID=A0A8T0F8Q6_ARGBR|nr:hypothetical protein HNY73_009176 [Argiope bruennichi]
MLFAVTVTAVASLISLIILTNASTLLNTFSYHFRKENDFSSEEKNILEEHDIASNFAHETSGKYLKPKIYITKLSSKDYYICILIKDMTISTDDIPFNFKCQVIEKSSVKEFFSNPSSSKNSRKFLPLADFSMTPFQSPLFQRKTLSLLETSPVGLGSGILGIGAVDLGHGLGRFIAR